MKIWMTKKRLWKQYCQTHSIIHELWQIIFLEKTQLNETCVFFKYIFKLEWDFCIHGVRMSSLFGSIMFYDRKNRFLIFWMF